MGKILNTTELAISTISGRRKVGIYKCEFIGNTPTKKVITEKKKLLVTKLKQLFSYARNASKFNIKPRFIELNKNPLVLLLIVIPERKSGNGGDVTAPTPPKGPIPKM
jgi:hypothetical protein